MNADYRNGVNHSVASQLPEPSGNGANGCQHQRADAQPANGEIGAGESGPSPLANGANGRDQRGRFAKGNPGAPGNPFARRTAQLRRVLSMAVSEEDIEAVAKRLLEQAKAGDVAAALALDQSSIDERTRRSENKGKRKSKITKKIKSKSEMHE